MRSASVNLRARTCPSPPRLLQQVTPLELFFDLVYVFAITQLSHLLLDHPTVVGALQTLFLLLVVWWAWQYTTWFTNWFDPAVLSVRLLLGGVMLASLVMSVDIPEAFGERGPMFALALRPSLEVTLERGASRAKRVRREVVSDQHAAAARWPAGLATDTTGQPVEESLESARRLIDDDR